MILWVLQSTDGRMLYFYASGEFSLNLACQAGEQCWEHFIRENNFNVATCYPVPTFVPLEGNRK